MKIIKNIVGLCVIAYFSFGILTAQSIPTIGSAVTMSTISNPFVQSQCVEPDGSIVRNTYNLYFGDTFSIWDSVPHWDTGNGYDTLLLNDSNIKIHNSSFFNFTAPVSWTSQGVPLSVNSIVAMQGEFVVNSINNAQLIYNIHRTALDNGTTDYNNIGYRTAVNGSTQYIDFNNKTFHNVQGWKVNGYECENYIVHYCGDGIVDTTSSIAGLVGGKQNSVAAEQCDPADSTHQGRGNLGCSSSCLPLNQNKPSCSLNISTMAKNVYSVAWNIFGIFNSPAQISIIPASANPSLHNVYTNIGSWNNISVNAPGTYTASMTVSNVGGSSTCTDTFTITPTPKVCGDGDIDWPNTAGVYEECDNGSGFGYGCATDCTLMTPTCTLLASPTTQLTGSPVSFSGITDSWADYISLNLGNTISGAQNIIYTGNVIFPYSYTYNIVQNYNQTLTVENNLVAIATGVVRPTAVCFSSVNVMTGCKIDISPQTIMLGDAAQIDWTIWPDFNIPAYMDISPVLVGSWPYNIYYKTGSTFVGPNIQTAGVYTFSINSWTTDGYNFACTGYLNVLGYSGNLILDKILLTTGQMLPGDFVDYKIELTNNGSGIFYDAYINDVLPESLDLISHSITGVSLYNSGEWQNNNGDRILEYSGFDLAPGQMVVMDVMGQVRQGSSANETTNCAFTSGDYDCVIYNLSSDPYVLKSQMMSNSAISTNFTTGILNVSVGDYITYKVDFANIGGANTSGGVRVVDHMPLCIDYISANVYGVNNATFGQSQDINGRYIIEYTGFDMIAGQTGYMIVTGQVMNTAACNLQNTYTNDSYVYFYHPSIVVSSSTTALKSNHSIVNITKSSNIDSHFPGDDKLFLISVENFGPNSISNIVLDDIWPTGTCISFVDRTGAGFTKDPISLQWTNTGPLLPGDSLLLSISGHIANTPLCVYTGYENVVDLTYVELGVSYTGSAVYYFDVLNTPLANISLIKTVNVSSVSSGDNIIYTIRYQNIGNTTLTNYVLFDYWPAMINFVSATPFPSSILNLATGSTLQWNFNTPLTPGQTGEIVLEGIVK